MWASPGDRVVEGWSGGSLLAEVEGVLTRSYQLSLASSSDSPRCEERRPPEQVWGRHAPLTLTPRTCSSASPSEAQDRPALVHSNLYLGRGEASSILSENPLQPPKGADLSLNTCKRTMMINVALPLPTACSRDSHLFCPRKKGIA